LRRSGESLVLERDLEGVREARSAGFRKTIVEAYDFQCAACGLRLRIAGLEVSFVDAAHIIPFSQSFNDHPTNGIALCKNHHWAMDRGLIAPSAERVWRVSKTLLAHRSSGEKELRDLQGRPVLPPNEIAYTPPLTAFAWRSERLIG